MSGFQVEPNHLYSTSSGADDGATQAQDMATQLANKLDGEGACWGGDAAGQAFAGKYVPAATQFLLSMCDTAQSLQSTADGLRRWAQNYVDVDELVAERAAELRGSLGA